VTPNLGAALDPSGVPTLVVYVCSAGQSLELTVIRDPDLLPNTGDESVLWDIRGRADAAGLLQMPVCVVPGGFREVKPLAEELEPDVRYAANLAWDRLDLGITFVPSELPCDRISWGTRVVTRGTFREDSSARCSL
jgi:hypothetical protein